MLESLVVVARQVGILFMLMGVGFVCRRVKLLGEASLKGMVDLLILVVTPCLIVHAFQAHPFEPRLLAGLGWAFALAALAPAIGMAAAYLVVRDRDVRTRSVLRCAIVFSNAGFMGIPLEQAVLGDGGVFYGIVYVVVFNLFMWSWGLRTMMNDELRITNEGRGHSKLAIRNSQFLKMIVNPGTVGLALGAPFFFLSVKLPAVIAVPVHHMANLNTPLAMIVIGYSLMGARFDKVVRVGALYGATAVRLVVCPLLAIAALYPFRHSLDRNMMLATVIAASAPVAAMVAMFAAKFDRDVDVSVAVVSGTTLLSILTMPVVIAFAMAVL